MEHQTETERPVNLVEGLTNEILRVTEISRIYKEVPGGAGNLAAYFMDEAIKTAKAAQGSGDVLEMIPAYNALKEFEL